ncbi:MAG: DUF134 domain-containing protein [Thermoplasmata archaeon]
MPQRRRRGRGRGRRWITGLPESSYFQPRGVDPAELNTVTLTLVDLEAIRLVDLLGLTQEEAAAQMGVSRKTFWNDLKSARKKVAMALTRGFALRIEGGNYILRGEVR